MLVSAVTLAAVVACENWSNTVDLHDAASDDTAVFVLGDACMVTAVLLGDPTVLVGLRDTTDDVTLRNTFVDCVALDTSADDITVSLITIMKDSAAEFLPKNVRLKEQYFRQ